MCHCLVSVFCQLDIMCHCLVSVLCQLDIMCHCLVTVLCQLDISNILQILIEHIFSKVLIADITGISIIFFINEQI